MISFRQYINETLASKLKAGDEVKNINKDCEHSGSKGKVISVTKLPDEKTPKVKNKHNTPGRKVRYKITNSGENYSEGDEIEKTGDQLKKIKSKT
jgi:hypothetical protein